MTQSRYAVQWKGTSRYGGANRLGETKQFGGHSYELQEVQGGAHRWVRVDKEPEQRQTSAHAAAGEPTPPPVQQSAAPPDPAQAHAFTKSQLGGIDGPAKGIMSAMHSHPDIQTKGVAVQDFAPNQGRQLHQWLRQNAGKTAGGGQAVDLGEGRMGFASKAGSVVVFPPKEGGGKWQVKYTNQTGLVARAMGGGRPAQPVGAAAPPSMAGENPFGQPRAAGAQPGFEPSKATPEQMASVSALAEKPAAPAAHATPRAAADEAKARLQGALKQWQDEVAGGLTPKGNARWRSYTAALRSIYGHHEQLARDWERKSKGGGKGKSADGESLSPNEAAAHKAAPEAFKQLQAMRDSFKNDEAYQDAVRQIAGSHDPWQGQRPLIEESQAERNPPIAGKTQGEQWRHAGDVFNKADEGFAMSKAGIDPRTGKPLGPTKRERERQMREDALGGFETEAQKQPEPIEGSDAWRATVNKKAEQWGMDPDHYHQIADDLYKEVQSRADEQKNAYLTARKQTGLTPANINNLENQGFDSGSKHAKIKGLDTLGRELAAEYPGLGWGRGREDEGNDEGNIDYAERVWSLIRDGYKPAPGRTSDEFLDHVDEFLASQQKHASSKEAAGEDIEFDPSKFSKVRSELLHRYRKWLAGSNERLTYIAISS